MDKPPYVKRPLFISLKVVTQLSYPDISASKEKSIGAKDIRLDVKSNRKQLAATRLF